MRHDDLTAQGSSVCLLVGSPCDELLWNTSDCHVCDILECLYHPSEIERVSKHYYGFMCVPLTTESYWIRYNIAIVIDCDASANEHRTIAIMLTPHPGPQDARYPRREYVLVIHARYFEDSARAKSMA